MEEMMKLLSEFVTYETEGEQIMAAAGADTFSGLVRSNETAAFIVRCLKTDTTEEAVVEAVLSEYDAPEEQVRADVKDILEKLRSIHALEE